MLLHTLERVFACGLPSESFEVIVVDNASSDGTSQAVAKRFGEVRLMVRTDNRGSCAKGPAIELARGEFVVFLDDDSFPHAGSVRRMVEHFEADQRLGAAGFNVYLPDGRRECSAFPDVFIGCGVGLRASALRAVGGLDVKLFMQAEEYDLSFRLIGAGWGIKTFSDLGVDHLKSPLGRMGPRTTYYDTRNNLLLVERYLPPPYRNVYRRDWKRRYGWLAAANGRRRSFLRGVLAASIRGPIDRRRYAPLRLKGAAFEKLFRLDDVRSRMSELSRGGVRRVVLADFGKNIYAFYGGAMRSGISVLAIADDRFARPGRRYRGIPLIPTAGIAELEPEAVVISNTSTVHAAETHRRLARKILLPIHRWFDDKPMERDSHFSSTGQSFPADTTTDVGMASTRSHGG